MAKTAVSAAARLFAARLCNEQIGVYEVRPGLIKTDMTIPATAYYDELIAKGLVPWDVGVIRLLSLPPSARWRKVNCFTSAVRGLPPSAA